MYGRSDLNRWSSAVAELENFIARPEGSASRRSGTRFGGAAKDETKKVVLIPFIFSNEDAYILEMNEQLCRVWTQEGLVQDSGQEIGVAVGTALVTLVPTNKFSVGPEPVNVISTAGTRMTDQNPPDPGPPVDVPDDQEFFIGIVNGGGGNNVSLFRDAAFTIPATLNYDGANPANDSFLAYANDYFFSTPWLEAELCDLRFAQSADVLYVVHENHPPQVITRRAFDDFRLEPFEFRNGPFRDENVEDGDTMEITAIVGDLDTIGDTIEITSNGLASFDAGRDIGRQFRIFVDKGSPKSYISIEITSVTTSLIMRGIITEVPLDAGLGLPITETTRWSLGFEVETPTVPTDSGLDAFIGGWPRTVTFHQQRLCFGGSPEFPENTWLSRTGRFDDFKDFTGDSEVNDDDSITQTLGDTTVNAIRWMRSNRVLVVGTNGGIYNVDSNGAGDAFTANNARSISVNSKPAANSDAAVFESVNAYISLTRGKVRGSKYDLGNDTYQSDDLSIFSDSLLESGVKQLNYADEPHSQLHALLNDGTLASLSFIGAQEVQGWNRVKVAGTFQGKNAFIESFTVIPSPAEDLHGVNVQYSQVWCVVRRTIDGADRRYIEFFENDFIDGGDLEDAFFVDSGLSLSRIAPQVGFISAITNANPAVMTIPATHGLSPGDLFKITHANGMPEVNGIVHTAGATTSTTAELAGVDSTSFGTYIDDGEMRLILSVISGLDHLEGETVQIVVDGTVYADDVVTSGTITIDPAGSEVHIGLGYTSTLEQLPFDQATQQGSGMGKIKRITHADVRIKDTVGGKVGVLGGPQENLTDRLVGDILDETTGLSDGWVSVSIDEGYTTEGRVAVLQEEPMPMTVVAITRSGETTTR